jgi:hypothetical protein
MPNPEGDGASVVAPMGEVGVSIKRPTQLLRIQEDSDRRRSLTVPSAGLRQAGNIGGTDYMSVNRSILGVPCCSTGRSPRTWVAAPKT